MFLLFLNLFMENKSAMVHISDLYYPFATWQPCSQKEKKNSFINIILIGDALFFLFVFVSSLVGGW